MFGYVNKDNDETAITRGSPCPSCCSTNTAVNWHTATDTHSAAHHICNACGHVWRTCTLINDSDSDTTGLNPGDKNPLFDH